MYNFISINVTKINGAKPVQLNLAPYIVTFLLKLQLMPEYQLQISLSD